MKKTRNGISWLEAGKRGGGKAREKKIKRVEKYNLDPLLCQFCKKLISYDKRRNRFCGHPCAASFNNLGVTRNIVSGLWKKKPCLHCGNKTENRKYCSRICEHKYTKQKLREKIKQAGRIFHKRDKWYLIETRGHKCEVCSTEEWMNKSIPLDTHHKDGDSDNNYLDNLLLICPNCHRQTKNHGSKNKTNSKRKQYRKKRYDDGLSY